MRNQYDAIYLAPHLDDVALSCGAQIAVLTRTGARVLIVTVMAGDPDEPELSDYVRSLHDRWQLAADAAAQRRAEDVAACAILGADHLQLAVPDCIYRTDPATGAPLYLSDPDIFGNVAPAEAYLVDEIAATLATLPPTARMVAPLTVGHHVDHLLVRASAERLWSKHELWYYEDYPYAQEPGTVDAVINADDTCWRTHVEPMDDAALAAKVASILAFRSQLSTFFTDRADLERQVRGYAAQVGGERLWQRATSAGDS
ncbi:MAG: PIG-L family deacetylase [Caldilineaceae bacterium]